MADGSVRIDVDIDAAKANRDLEKLKNKIQKFEAEISKNRSKRESIIPNLGQAYAELDDIIEKVKYLREKVSGSKGDKKLLYKEELAEALEDQKALTSRVSDMEREYDKAGRNVEKLTEKLDATKSEAGAIEKAMGPTEEESEGISRNLGKGRGRLKQFLKAAIGISSLAVLFSKLRKAIKDAIDLMAEDSGMKPAIDSFRQALAQLRLDWASAFMPIAQVVIPILSQLISWLSSAAMAIANFLAQITGRGTFKRAIANTEALEKNVGGVGGAAQEAKKQLAGFDELTILDDNSGGGGGGAGAGGYDFEEQQVEATAFGTAVRKVIEEIKDLWLDLKSLFAGDTTLKDFIEQLSPGQEILLGIATGIAAIGLAWAAHKVFEVFKFLATLPQVLSGLSPFLGIGLLIAGIVTAALAFIKMLQDGFSWAQEAIMLLGIALAAVAAIILGAPAMVALVIAGIIAAVATLFVVIKEHWDKIKEFLGKVADAFLEFTDGIQESLNRLMENITGELSQHFNTLSVIITGAINTALAVLETAAQVVAVIFNTIIAVVSSVVATIGAIATGDWAGACEIFAQVWSNVWESIKNTFRGAINILLGLLETLVNLFLSAINTIFRGINTVARWFGGSTNLSVNPITIPRLAKGGIVDAATLFMAGESGKEAVIPLENNTGWINQVADAITDRMSRGSRLGSAIAGIPMPAMAGGSIVPPGATSNAYGSGWNNDLLSELKSLQEAVNRLASQPVEVTSRTYLDKREIATAVTQAQRDMQRAGGR